MKVFVVNDSFCGVYGVYQSFEQAAKKFEELFDRLYREKDLSSLGRSKYRMWYDTDYGQQILITITESELK